VDPHLRVVDRVRVHDLSDIPLSRHVGAAARAIRQPPNCRLGNDSHRTIALVLAWIQHRRDIRALQADYGAMPFSIAGLIAALIAGLGAIALIGVTLRF